MKIGEIEKRTGLTAKAIRLYEEKGLLTVARRDNSYRDYSKLDVERLTQIKVLREMGISLSEIRLYFNGVITRQELLLRCKEKLQTESAANRENYARCLALLEECSFKDPMGEEPVRVLDTRVLYLGLDLGSTTISAALITATGEVIGRYCINNAARLPTAEDFYEYDVTVITEKTFRMLDYLMEAYPNIHGIGITGQMHGILYLDKNGKACSPLYNWQDARADQSLPNGKNYCREIFERTGHQIYSGYGFATLFYNRRNGLEPVNAYSFCSVMDYFVLCATNRRSPLIHPSIAASFGLYSTDTGSFDAKAVEKLELSHLKLPEIAHRELCAGTYRGCPLMVAIGDNQASFFGAVQGEEKVGLLNFGTGSQISVAVSQRVQPVSGLELRPYLFDDYLLCGAALCGGKAYALLEKFFSAYTKELIPEAASQYEVMNAMAERDYGKKEPLAVSTLFCGTRSDPKQRGTISGISENNFTPSQLVLGVLYGMAHELKEFYDQMEVSVDHLIASGGAVQKNPILCNVLADIFGMRVSLSQEDEESAVGAALYTKRMEALK